MLRSFCQVFNWKSEKHNKSIRNASMRENILTITYGFLSFDKEKITKLKLESAECTTDLHRPGKNQGR